MPILDPDDVATFERHGFVVTKDLLSLDELSTFGRAVDQAVAARTSDDGRTVDEKTAYEQSFVQCMRVWETDRDVRPLTFHARLAEAAAELLGVKALRLWQDQALYKESGGRETDPHQDAPFWPIGDAPLVTAWIPFDGSRVEQGAMGYVPGSHKVGRLRTVNLTRPDEAHDILTDPALGGSTPEFIEAPAGSVVWHHGHTVHQATANTTNTVRRAFTIVYIADGSIRTADWPTFPLDRAGVGVGDPIEGDGLPLVWPAADDTLPEPPAVIGSATGPQRGSA